MTAIAGTDDVKTDSDRLDGVDLVFRGRGVGILDIVRDAVVGLKHDELVSRGRLVGTVVALTEENDTW